MNRPDIEFKIRGLHGNLSPNGNYLAFQRWSEHGVDLFLFDFANNKKVFIDTSDPTVPRWSPNSLVVFYGKKSPTKDIYSYNILSKEIKRITYNNNAWGFNIDKYGNSVYCYGNRPDTKIIKTFTENQPIKIINGWHPSIFNNLLAFVNKKKDKNIIKIYDIRQHEVLDEFKGVLPCIINEKELWYTVGRIPDNRIYFKRICKEPPVLFSELPLRHPEFRIIRNKKYLVCEYAESEDSEVFVYRIP